ncbi:MAG: hypothetical protein KJ025_07110 [Burkholderiales bacterium]|nr:hypothetical protein [Burkholderiales bacterium]
MSLRFPLPGGAPVAALIVALTAGCAATDSGRPGASDPGTVTSAINLSGFPPEFRRGFSDGCAAARAGQPGARPPADGQYAVGWNDGFDYCKPRDAK